MPNLHDHQRGCLGRAWAAAMVIAMGLCLSQGPSACKPRVKQDPAQNSQEALAAVGKEVGLSFPEAAKLVGVHRERGADDLIAVKVDMPASEWPGFLSRTPVDPSLFRAGERGLLGPDQGFWDPHKAKNLRTVETSLPNGRVLNLGYDDSRGAVFAVYVVNHST